MLTCDVIEGPGFTRQLLVERQAPHGAARLLELCAQRGSAHSSRGDGHCSPRPTDSAIAASMSRTTICPYGLHAVSATSVCYPSIALRLRPRSMPSLCAILRVLFSRRICGESIYNVTSQSNYAIGLGVGRERECKACRCGRARVVIWTPKAPHTPF